MRTNTAIYKESHRKAKMVIQTKKREYLKSKIEEIGESRVKNEMRKFYGTMKCMNKGFQAKTIAYKEKNGEILEQIQMINKWKKHFRGLLKCK